ncbi:MAG: hypothetical protein K6T65_01350 [Peptococcaceae bacterium]|nr:hypothetical protein [Peptococcaceae bacterium]
MPTTNSLEFMRKAHRLITKLKYELDHVIEDEKEAIGDYDPNSPVDGVKAWVEDEVLRITVDECLPRSRSVIKEMRDSWLRKLSKVMLGIDISFERALCIISVYSSRNGDWDVDNRAYKVIPDALRIAGKIKNDDCHNLTIMVTGGLDKEYPRTEIFVVENPFSEQMFVKKIIEIVKLHIIEEKK